MSLIVVSGCDETGTEPLPGTELYGVWELSEVDYTAEAVCAIEQEIHLEFKPGVGAITISGDLNADLTYMYSSGSGLAANTRVSNQLFFLEDLPRYALTVWTGNPAVNWMELEVLLEDSTRYYFETGGFIGSYDLENMQLTLEPMSLIAGDSITTITLGGQLGVETIILAPGEASSFSPLVPLAPDVLGMESSRMVLLDDLEFQLITKYENPLLADTSIGSWRIDEGTIITSMPSGYGWSDTEILTYSVDNEDLILSKLVACDDYYYPEDCLSANESTLDLEPGSLVSYQETQRFRYSRVKDDGSAKKSESGIGKNNSFLSHWNLGQEALLFEALEILNRQERSH